MTQQEAAKLLASGDDLYRIAGINGWLVGDNAINGDYVIPRSRVWHVSDGHSELVYDGEGSAPIMPSAAEAARHFLETGDYPPTFETVWITLSTWREALDSRGNVIEINRN